MAKTNALSKLIQKITQDDQRNRIITVISIVLISLLLILVHLLFFNYLAKDLLAPERRAIQPYHQAYLLNSNIDNNPYNNKVDNRDKKHNKGGKTGMLIEKRATKADGIPYLLVEPDTDNIGKRGYIIRQQLLDKGFTSADFNLRNGIIVLIHGRSGRKEDLLPVAERFAALGFYCVLPDLPAHGDSPETSIHFASTPFEKNYANLVLRDIQDTLNLAEPLPAYLWGMSLGGVFANAAASTNPDNWQAMVIVASFDSLEQTLKARLTNHHVPNILHDGYIRFLQQRIDSQSMGQSSVYKKGMSIPITKITPEQWAQRVTMPTLVIHGDKDQVIDIEQGKKLYDAYPSADKQWLEVKDANHNNILITPAPVYATMAMWLLEHKK